MSWITDIIYGSPAGSTTTQNQLVQANQTQGQVQQALQAQQQVNAISNQVGQQQVNAISNQVGQILHSSIYCPQGTGYISSGQLIMNPQDINPDVAEQMKREYLSKKKEQFLKHSQTHRNAFLDSLRAKKVSEDMDSDNSFFGVNRAGYASWQAPESRFISLEQYEEWDASAIIDEILDDETVS